MFNLIYALFIFHILFTSSYHVSNILNIGTSNTISKCISFAPSVLNPTNIQINGDTNSGSFIYNKPGNYTGEGYQSPTATYFLINVNYSSNNLHICANSGDNNGWTLNLNFYAVEFGICNAGYYEKDNLCLQCNAGCACSLGSKSSCELPCAAGYYCPIASTSIYQNNCPAGSFCIAGSSTSIACNTLGYYCPINSQSATQYICSAGYYGSSGGVTTASCNGNCSAGYYCSSGSTSPTQTICPSGYYCGIGSGIPTPCPAGTFNSFTFRATLSSCSGICNAGYYCPAGSSNGNAFICPAGYYCPSATGNYLSFPCPAGKFSNLTGQISSSTCTGVSFPGYFSPTGSTSGTVSLCSVGYFCTGAAINGTQWDCPTGTYCLSGATSPTNCTTLGYYCPINSQSPTQYPCSPGTYGNQTGLSSPSCSGLCPKGYYCPAGTNYPKKFICPLGHYCLVGTNSSTQYPCPIGKYGATLGLSNSNCTGPCNPGFKCPLGSSNPNQATCPAGYYCLLGTVTPTQCNTPGYYCPTNTQFPTQYPCSAGRFGNSAGLTNYSCTGPCTAGYYCEAGSTTPTQYNCTATYYCPEGASSPITCPKGYYCPTSTSTAKQYPCYGGYYGATSGFSTPSCSGPCLAGKYCPTGSYKQKTCLEGGFCPVGSEYPLNCTLPGYFCPTGTSNATEYPCPPGFYGNTPRLTNQLCSGYCSAGYYGNSFASTNSSCNGKCSAGYYCNTGSTTATQNICLPGFYCPEGSSSPYTFPCPAGKYGNSTGLPDSFCAGDCPPGFYCPSGTVNPFQNNCTAGFFCDSGTVWPLQCNITGYFCGVRSTSPSQSPCLPGYFGNTAPQSNGTCSGPCQAGYYCESGSTTSTQYSCPAGYYCPSGTATPVICNSPGYYCPQNSTRANMVLCSAGTYGNTQGLSSASCTGNCSQSYYCLAGSVSQTQNLCPPGYYCQNSTQTANQNPCDAGYYGVSYGRSISHCDGACSPGYYCNAGSTTPTQFSCPSGLYCPAGSSSPQNCPAGTTTLTSAQFICVTAIATVSSITSTNANGYYPIGSIIDIVVNFASVTVVYVTTSELSLALVLDNGIMVYSNYTSGNGSLALHFQYTVRVNDVATKLRVASLNPISGTIVGPDFISLYNSSSIPTTLSSNSLYSLKSLTIAGKPDSTSSVSCDKRTVSFSNSINCIITPRYQGIQFQFNSSQFTLQDTSASGSFSTLIPSVNNNMLFTFVYTASNVLGDTNITIAPGNFFFSVSVYRNVDSTSVLSCTPTIVPISTVVNCTTTTNIGGSATVTNSAIIVPVMNRTVLVSQGGTGHFTNIPIGILASSFSFQFTTPPYSGPMKIWDSVSGNTVLLQVYESYSNQVFAPVNSNCQ